MKAAKPEPITNMKKNTIHPYFFSCNKTFKRSGNNAKAATEYNNKTILSITGLTGRYININNMNPETSKASHFCNLPRL